MRQQIPSSVWNAAHRAAKSHPEIIELLANAQNAVRDVELSWVRTMMMRPVLERYFAPNASGTQSEIVAPIRA